MDTETTGASDSTVTTEAPDVNTDATVDLSPPEPADDDVEDVEQPKPGAERQTRKQRNGERLGDMVREMRKELKELRAERSQQRQPEPRREPDEAVRAKEQAAEGEKQHKGKLKSMRDEMRHQLAIANAENVAPEVYNRALEKYYALQDEIEDLKLSRTEEKLRGELQAVQAKTEGNSDAEFLEEFPWLNDQANYKATLAQVRYLVDVEGAPHNKATARRAAALIAAKRGLGATPPASERDKGRFTSATEGRRGAGEAKQFQFTNEEMEIFRATTPRGEKPEKTKARRDALARAIVKEDPSRIRYAR